MSVNTTDMATAVKNSVAGKETVCFTDFIESVGTYLTSNLDVNFAWVATNPAGGAPDPVTTATGSVTATTPLALVSTVLENCSSSQEVWDHVASQLQLWFSTCTYTITDAGFAVTPAVIGAIGSPSLTPFGRGLNEGETMTAYIQAAFAHVMGDIISWVTSYVPVTPCSGTHGVYVGVATVTSLS